MQIVQGLLITGFTLTFSPRYQHYQDLPAKVGAYGNSWVNGVLAQVQLALCPLGPQIHKLHICFGPWMHNWDECNW
jgi:hypothetical protein